jgi:transposase
MELVPLSSSSHHLPLPTPIEACPELPVLTLVTITQKELTRLKWEGSYWKAQHLRACEREAHLKQELEEKEARIRDLRHRLFGIKSEAAKSTEKAQAKLTPSRPRGQQRGSRGHGRIQRPDLPIVYEHIELPADSCCCSHCGLPFDPFPGDEESEILEIEVSAHRRKVCRKRYRKICSCPSTVPDIIVASLPPKIIPKSSIGISVWVQILLAKYLYAQPLHRILRQLAGFGLPLAQGTITGGLQKILPLFLPLYQALYEHQMSETLFHNDESRWYVFAEITGKVGHRWYLWLTRSLHVIFYRIAPTRSAAVPIAHFSKLEATKVIVVVDRYSSYKKTARKNKAIILAYCWVHVRRDFLEVAGNFPKLKEWANEWIDAIGTLYYLNHQRLVHWQETLPLKEQSVSFHEAQALLEQQLAHMKERCDSLLQVDQAASQNKPNQPPADNTSAKLHPAQRKALASLNNHWNGLTVFVNNPQVPMDNNPAEQAIRNPVCGRKNYYGSGSTWSAELAAVMFSLFQTLELWHINPRHWLQQYLLACAQNSGATPKDLSPFLPWKMSFERRQELAKPPPIRNTS